MYQEAPLIIYSTTAKEITQLIDSMNNVGGGHDGVNTKLFKATYSSIIKELVHFMNLCIDQCTFPSSLKKAVIKPIYKTGDKQLFTNYRPISLLPVISKILEKLIYTRIDDYLTLNNILNENQFGFRKGRSTYMPLLLLQDEISKCFETGKIACGLPRFT